MGSSNGASVVASCSTARVTLSNGTAIRHFTQRATQNPTIPIPAKAAAQRQHQEDHSPFDDANGGGPQRQAPTNRLTNVIARKRPKTCQNTRVESMNGFRRLTVLPEQPYATGHSAGGNQARRPSEKAFKTSPTRKRGLTIRCIRSPRLRVGLVLAEEPNLPPYSLGKTS